LIVVGLSFGLKDFRTLRDKKQDFRQKNWDLRKQDERDKIKDFIEKK